jgi:hypothetical protein
MKRPARRSPTPEVSRYNPQLLRAQYPLEARDGIEPSHRAFAELGLTTWLPRRNQESADVAGYNFELRQDLKFGAPARRRPAPACGSVFWFQRVQRRKFDQGGYLSGDRGDHQQGAHTSADNGHDGTKERSHQSGPERAQLIGGADEDLIDPR